MRLSLPCCLLNMFFYSINFHTVNQSKIKLENAEISGLLSKAFEDDIQDIASVIPLRPDGSEYSIENLAIDQKECLAEVLSVLKQYCDGVYVNQQKVLRLTVSGGAGSGKSTWINTLVTIMRKMFPEDNTVSVFAPTGAAAYNAGGQTLHAGFLLSLNFDSPAISGNKQKVLLGWFAKTLAIIIDERSMLDATILGTIKHYMQQCGHGGKKTDHPWGGIPLVILVGDDFQLPSIMPGAFYALHKGNLKHTKNQFLFNIRNEGFEEFLEMGKKVICLDGEKRVNQGQDIFKRILRASHS